VGRRKVIEKEEQAIKLADRHGTPKVRLSEMNVLA
jgi:hypothetical protein